MGNIGTWRSPLPMRLGGRGHQRVTDLHETVVASRGSLLSGGDSTLVDAENKMIARMLCTGLRAVGRRVAQRNPGSLSTDVREVISPDTGATESLSPLVRWERILGFPWQSSQSLPQRRAAVRGRFVGFVANTRQVVTDAMQALFGSWFVGLHENDLGDVDYAGRSPAGDVQAYWATGGFSFSAQYPGRYDASRPWYSGLAIITAVVQPQATAQRAEVNVKVGEAKRLLGDLLPAWALGEVSVMPVGQTDDGFILDVSELDYTAL